MNGWTHPMCGKCWYLCSRAEEPTRVKEVNPDPVPICCFCGAFTKQGIFVRADPALLECKHT